MAHILATGMPVISHEKSFENDPDLQKTLDDLVKLSQRPEVPWREKCYVDATVHWAHRYGVVLKMILHMIPCLQQ